MANISNAKSTITFTVREKKERGSIIDLMEYTSDYDSLIVEEWILIR